MTNNIHQLIAAISAEVYCDRKVKREVKRMLREGFQQQDDLAYLKAAAKARPVEPNRINLEELELQNPFSLPGFKSPVERHSLVFDSMEESQEAYYFWMLDQLAQEGWTVSKLVDTFAAAPGSGLFAEMNRRGIQAQQQAMRMLREAQGLVHGILQTVAVRKRQSKPEEGPSSGEPGREEVERELLRWKVETLKLYARWLGPYLRQARSWQQHPGMGPKLVSVFNTATVQVILLAEREYAVKEDVDRGDLPKLFLQARHRPYFPVLLVELNMRTAPERTPGGAYAYCGQRELILTSYALNADELAVLRKTLDQDNLGAVIDAVAGKAQAPSNEILRQIDRIVSEPAQPKPQPDDPNPFVALFSFLKPLVGGQSENKTNAHLSGVGPICPDSEVERVLRSQAIIEARRRCLEFYGRCKQELQMVSF